MHRHIKLIENDTLIGSIYKDYIKDDALMESLLRECFNYVLVEVELTKEIRCYMDELKELLVNFSIAIRNNNEDDCKHFWNCLLESGIFHDAIGKVLSYDDNSFEVSYDY